MEMLTVTQFRNNLSAAFDRAERGETVYIRRKNKIYALMKEEKEALVISPALQRRIEEAEKSCQENQCTSCRTNEELDAFFDSL